MTFKEYTRRWGELVAIKTQKELSAWQTLQYQKGSVFAETAEESHNENMEEAEQEFRDAVAALEAERDADENR